MLMNAKEFLCRPTLQYSTPLPLLSLHGCGLQLFPDSRSNSPYPTIIALPYHYFPNHRFACYSQVPVSGTYLFGAARVLELTRGA